MGYYSDFNITIKDYDREKYSEDVFYCFVDFCRNRRDDADCYGIIASMDRYGNESLYDNMKWYSCEEDMKTVSAAFPDVLFEVQVTGEETGDLWKLYAKNGKVQRADAEIIYPEYDENEMH